jgi:hypothetical protein
MAYSIATAFAIYFVLWWVVLFLTLPFGVRSQHEDGESVAGTDPGAPIVTRMGRNAGLQCWLPEYRAADEADGDAVLDPATCRRSWFVQPCVPTPTGCSANRLQCKLVF